MSSNTFIEEIHSLMTQQQASASSVSAQQQPRRISRIAAKPTATTAASGSGLQRATIPPKIDVSPPSVSVSASSYQQVLSDDDESYFFKKPAAAAQGQTTTSSNATATDAPTQQKLFRVSRELAELKRHQKEREMFFEGKMRVAEARLEQANLAKSKLEQELAKQKTALELAESAAEQHRFMSHKLQEEIEANSSSSSKPEPKVSSLDLLKRALHCLSVEDEDAQKCTDELEAWDFRAAELLKHQPPKRQELDAVNQKRMELLRAMERHEEELLQAVQMLKENRLFALMIPSSKTTEHIVQQLQDSIESVQQRIRDIELYQERHQTAQRKLAFARDACLSLARRVVDNKRLKASLFEAEVAEQPEHVISALAKQLAQGKDIEQSEREVVASMLETLYALSSDQALNSIQLSVHELRVKYAKFLQ